MMDEIWLLIRRLPACGREAEELYQHARLVMQRTKCGARDVHLLLRELRCFCSLDTPLSNLRSARQRISRANQLLARQLHRSPTLPEVAQALRMDPVWLVWLMEQIYPSRRLPIHPRT